MSTGRVATGARAAGNTIAGKVSHADSIRPAGSASRAASGADPGTAKAPVTTASAPTVAAIHPAAEDAAHEAAAQAGTAGTDRALTAPQRYLLIQIPSWVLAAIIVYALERWTGLPWWGAAALWGAYVVKDIVLFPFLRAAYEEGPGHGAERLVGKTGRAEHNGYVRVQGELWQAEVASGSPPVATGDRVRVESARGMKLVVRVEPGPRLDVQ